MRRDGAVKDAFAERHPLNNFIFFALVIGCGMCLLHPLCLAVNLGSAAAYSILRGEKLLKKARLVVPAALLVLAVNAAFNHAGVTVLCYLPGGNALTAEAIAAGAAYAAMFAAMLLWFGSFSSVMDTDKLVWLFGRAMPSLALLLSMSLRLVPRLKSQTKRVREARRSLGYTENGRSVQRLREAAAVYSAVIGWALENSAETADSMRGRGYGLKGRTAYSVYRMDERETALLVWLVTVGGLTLSAAFTDGFYWRYYPTVRGGELTPLTVFFFCAYTALCLTPVILQLAEDGKWKHLK